MTKSAPTESERRTTQRTTHTGSDGVLNTRARIVGARTGVLAELIVSIVRGARFMASFVSRLFGRITAVVSTLGWVVAVFGMLSLVIGYSYGIVEFVIAGWFCVALWALAALFAVARGGYKMTLRLDHGRVVAGQQASGAISISNGRRIRTIGTLIEIPVGERMFEFLLPSLRPGESFEQHFVIPTTHRGVIEVGPVRTVRADPVGLVRREQHWTDAIELFVHPVTIGIPSTTVGFIRDLEGNPTTKLADSDVSFHALREYVSGDDRRHIHWKSSARTGRYMVRQYEETRRSHLLVVTSLASSDYLTDEEFELAVSVTGSLGTRAIRDSRTVSVVASEQTPEWAKHAIFALRRLPTITPTRLLDELTRVEAAVSALKIRDTARVASESVSGISVAFLVTGSGTSFTELRAAAASFPLDVSVIAVVCDPDAAPGLRRFPGLGVLTIGYLDELASALSRSASA